MVQVFGLNQVPFLAGLAATQKLLLASAMEVLLSAARQDKILKIKLDATVALIIEFDSVLGDLL